MGRPKKVQPEDAPAAAPVYPKIDILSRRLDDPLGSVTPTIRLKTPVPTGIEGDTWATRWIDSSQQGRVFDILEHKGWERVRVKELYNASDIAGLTASVDGGYVTRGDKEREWLVKMPTSWWTRIHQAKVAVWSGAGKSKKDRKMGIADEVARAVQSARNSGTTTTLSPDEAGELTMSLKGTLPGGKGITLSKGPMIPDGDPVEDFI